MRKYLLASVLVFLLAAIFAIPLSAAEKEGVKIKLPDGFYMYSSSIEKLQDGSERIGFGKYFVVYKNNIYSAKDAVKKFGISKLNTLFGGAKKYIILCPMSGGQIGQIYSVIIEDEEEWDYKETFFTRDIKQGPAYGKESIYLGRLGSATKCMAVPEEYKEVKKKVYTTIPQEEVDKIAKLAREKLLQLVINRKEFKKYKIKNADLDKEDLLLLDKITYPNNDLYIGIYEYAFKIRGYFIVFAIIKENIYVITSNYSDEVPDYDGAVSMYGMLDVDGDGNEELIMEKVFSGPDEAIYNIEIYRQKADGKWERIQRINWEVKS